MENQNEIVEVRKGNKIVKVAVGIIVTAVGAITGFTLVKKLRSKLNKKVDESEVQETNED